MKKSRLICLVSLFMFHSASAVEPTANREWTSAKGQTLKAQAMSLSLGKITMKRANGKTFTMDINLLSEEDQDFVKKHFEPEEVKPAENADTPSEPATKKGRRRGKRGGAPRIDVLGPVTSVEGSKYIYYLPKTVLKDRKIASIFWVGGGRAGNAKDVQRFAQVAELTGMAVVSCITSSNSTKGNYQHMDNNIKHSIEKLNLDENRMFFSGPSGGGARTFRNAAEHKSGGSMPLVGYIPTGFKPTKGPFYFVMTGAYDFNRYSSAYAAKTLGNNALYRPTVGGHGGFNDPAALADGIIWLFTRNAYEKKGTERDEIALFEERFYSFLTTNLVNEPWRAYFWTDHLLNTCKISGSNVTKFRELHNQLGKSANNVKYLEGMVALDKFGDKYFAPFGKGSRMKHTTSEIVKAAKKLSAEYAGVPVIENIAKDLAKKTDKL